VRNIRGSSLVIERTISLAPAADKVRVTSVTGFETGFWCPASGVRDTLPRILPRTPEAKGAPASYMLFVPLFDLKFLNETAAVAQKLQIGGTKWTR
jgi:hypothetical protein